MLEKIQDAISRVRSTEWAQPVGRALGTTAKIVDCVGDFIPGAGFLGGALKLGAELLDPATTMDDLQSDLTGIKDDLKKGNELSARAIRALEKEKAEVEASIAQLGKTQTEIRSDIQEVQEDVQMGFSMMARDLKCLEKDVSEIKDKIRATYDIVCDIQYKNGIDRIEATYVAFINGSSDVGKVITRFSHYAMEFQTEFYQHMKTEKITKFLKIVMEKDGAEACQAMYQSILIVKSKYLQMIVMYFIYQNEPDTVAKEFEKFNRDFFDFQSNYETIVKERKVPGAQDQCNKVHNFLEACGLIKYKEMFQAQNVTIEDLLDMDVSEMQQIGVTIYRDRKILNLAIQEHRTQGI